uniref:Uncharacterized protein n=1 Tax=Aegilops tauschii subsp. strangulata TaxID=200361 RepID=A0A453HY64_AEGTS
MAHGSSLVRSMVPILLDLDLSLCALFCFRHANDDLALQQLLHEGDNEESKWYE